LLNKLLTDNIVIVFNEPNNSISNKQTSRMTIEIITLYGISTLLVFVSNSYKILMTQS
jgi:hypothetical protein